MRDRAYLAKIIKEMEYGELRHLGRELRDMTDPAEGVWDLRKDQDWSDMLYAWAENNIETE